ncbi:nuclear transport factor 2 family protein [Aurantivibrio plasticivorans]
MIIKHLLTFVAGTLVLVCAANSASAASEAQRIATAKRFFQGVYSSDSSVVDELASENITISYPAFEQLFGKPALNGREDVRGLVTWFPTWWSVTQIDFPETMADGDKVFLKWRLVANYMGPIREDQKHIDPAHIWEGITLFRFDESGKIVEEVGFESEPQPFRVVD